MKEFPKSRSCTGCKEDKPLDDFGPVSNGKYGRRARCRVCVAKQNRSWMAANRESYRSYKRAYFADPKNKRRERCKSLQRKYGITLECYEKMFKAQNGACRICLMPEEGVDKSGTKKQLSVDHNHQTGFVRGLLCFRCNSALARFEELGPSSLDRLKNYLWGS